MSEEKLKPAIFISESPEFNEEQGTEHMTWIVFVGMDIDDEPDHYVRCFTLDAAWSEAESIHRRHPDYEFVGPLLINKLREKKMTIFIYQFQSTHPEAKETIFISDERLDEESIEMNRPTGTEFFQMIEAEVISGDADYLPRDRNLSTNF